MNSNAIQRKVLPPSKGKDERGSEAGYQPPSLSVMDGGGGVSVINADRAIAINLCDANEGCRRNEKAKDDDGDTTSSSSSDTDSTIRIKDLKLLWVLFQCVWPAVLLSFCDYMTMPQLVIPYALTFWMVSFAIRENIFYEFVNS